MEVGGEAGEGGGGDDRREVGDLARGERGPEVPERRSVQETCHVDDPSRELGVLLF